MSADLNILDLTRQLYEIHAKKATKELSDFVSTLDGQHSDLCVTYFDEAHQLEAAFWVLMRVLSFQDTSIRMWYVVMGTRSSFQQYNPRAKDCESLI